MSGQRILFASCHGYLDRSSGAATATRDLMELLASRGYDCRVLTTGIQDFRRETPLREMLAGIGVDATHSGPTTFGGTGWLEFEAGGVHVTLLPTASSRIERSPDLAESAAFLEMAAWLIDRGRPEILLTYGGHPANLGLMSLARRRGVAVVFHLHNLAYDNPAAFADATAVVVASRFARRYYEDRLGLSFVAIPNALRPDRVVAADPRPRYLTFVNPEVNKGVVIFARIAAELNRRRPDIPLLVVEGRATADDLIGQGVTIDRMATTNDPREFYRVSRAILAPSIVAETFGRVAAEALTNGIPVLASDRGALPETLGDAGFVFSLPRWCLEGQAPTAHDVEPWVATVERLWDDPRWEAEHRARARAESARWEVDRVVDAHAALFHSLAGRGG